jgi:hypothetical protein
MLIHTTWLVVDYAIGTGLEQWQLAQNKGSVIRAEPQSKIFSFTFTLH